MADGVVSFTAVADFQKVQSEAKKTQSALSDLQKQIDTNNAKNTIAAKNDANLQAAQHTAAGKADQDSQTFLGRMAQIAAAQKAASTNTTALTKAQADNAKSQKTVSDAADVLSQANNRAAQSAISLEQAHLKEQSAAKNLEAATRSAANATEKFGAESDQAVQATARLESAKNSSARASLGVEAAEQRVSVATNTLQTAIEASDRAIVHHAASDANLAAQHDKLSNSSESLGDKVIRLGENFSQSESNVSSWIGTAGALVAKWGAIAAAGIQLLPVVVSLVAAFFSLGSAIAPAVGALAAVPVAATVAGIGLGTILAALQGVSTALKAHAALQQADAVGGTAAANTAISNAQAIASAQHGLQEAYYNAGLTAQQNADQARSDAQSVTNALYSQEQAQVSLNLATQAATKNIRDLALASQSAALQEAGATLNLQQAQLNLQQVNNNPQSTSLQRQQAALAVQQAQLQVQTSKNAASDAAQASTVASTAGVSGAQSVIDAQHNLAQQNLTVADAYRTQAEQAMAALHSTADAVYAVAQAQQSLANAQRTASQGTGAAATAAIAYAAALAKLTPEGRAFVAQLESMHSGLKGVEDAAATATLPGFTSFLKSVATLFPTVKTVVGETGSAIGGFAKNLGTQISGPAWVASLQTLGAGSANIITILGQGFQAFANIMRQVTVAALPFTTWLAQSATDWIKQKDAVLGTGDGYSRFTAWLGPGGPVRTALTDTGTILKNIGDFFYNMGKAAGDSGRNILGSIGDITGKWAAWSASTTGQGDMKKYFADARDILAEVSHGVGILFDWIAKLSGNSDTKKFLTDLGTSLGPFFALLGQIFSSSLGQNLITIVEQLFKAFQDLTGNGQLLQGFADALEGVVSALSWFVQVPGIADIITGIALAFGAYKAINFLSSITGIKGLTGAVTDFVKAGKQAPAGSSLGATLASGAAGVGVKGKDLTKAQSDAIDAANLKQPAPGESLTSAHRQAIADAGLAQPTNAVAGKVTSAKKAAGTVGGAFSSAVGVVTGRNKATGSHATPTEEEKAQTGEEEKKSGSSAKSTTKAIAGGGAVGLGALAGAAGIASQIPAFAKFAPILQEIAVGAGLASAAMTLLDIAMDANPITLIVIGLIALGVALYEAYEHSKTFRDIVDAIGRVCKQVALDIWKDGLKPAFDGIVTAIDFVKDHWKLFALGLAIIMGPIGLIGIAIYELATHWKDVWGIIQDVWNTVGKPLFDVLMFQVNIWWTVNKAIFDLFVLAFKGLWDLAVASWNSVGKPIFDLIGTLIGLWWSGIKLTFNLVGDGFSLLWSGMKDIWGRVGRPVFDTIKSSVGMIAGWFSDMSSGVQGIFNDLSSALGKIWDGIETVFTTPITWLVNTVLDQWLVGNINKILSAVGITGLPAVHLNTGGQVPPSVYAQAQAGFNQRASAVASQRAAGMATGGGVPGYGNTDTVPAMLTPGEYVIRKDAAQAIGLGNLNALNSAGGAGGSSGSGGSGVGHFLGGITGALGDVTGAISSATSAVSGYVSKVVRGGAADAVKAMLTPFRAAIASATSGRGIIASALNKESDNVMDDIVSWIRGVDKKPVSQAATGAQSSAGLNSSQMYNAERVIAAGQARGASARDIEVALMTGMTESSMRALANPSVPASMSLAHDGIGTDHDSVGVFQQRNSWGSAAARLDPYQSANLFFNRLLSIASRNNEPMGNEAQQVQVSAYPTRYAAWQNWATSLYATLTNNAGEANLRSDAAGYAIGGGVPGSGNTDTVPAMLTPGEYVINKRAAAAIGPANLAMMNSVQKLNTGGPVLGIAPGASGPYISALRYQMMLRDAASSGFGQDLVNAIGGANVTTPPVPYGPFDDLNSDKTGFAPLLGKSASAALVAMLNSNGAGQSYDQASNSFFGGMPWELMVRAYEASAAAFDTGLLKPVQGASTTSTVGGAVQYYTVKSGDNMSKIAAANHISLAQLEAWNPQIKNPNLIYAGNVLKVGQSGTTTVTTPGALTGPNIHDPWMANLAGASTEHKGWMSGLQTAMQLTANGDMDATDQEPFLHALYHAMGTAHSAGLEHPWSGPLTAVEQALDDSDHANAINKQWFADLTTIADWGFKYLLDDLLAKGPSDGLALADSAAGDQATASALNQSLKTGQTTGLGGLAASDQTNILNAIAALAQGQVPGFNGPVGIRALAQLLQIPDYGVVNMYDRIMAAGTGLNSSQTAQLTADVTSFRHGTFYAASGGRVPGSGSGDTVPAMLTPGEFVLKKSAADALGMTNLMSMNNMTQAFADGGLVSALNSSGVPSFVGTAVNGAVNRIKRGGTGTDQPPTIINIDTEINNPVGENSAYSLLKMLQGQAATGVFDRDPQGGTATMNTSAGS